MARVYSPNENHSCDYGIDFDKGVAVIPDSETSLLAKFTAKGYTVKSGKDSLSMFDQLTSSELAQLAYFTGVLASGKTKAQLVEEIESQLGDMKVEITSFNKIADVDAGSAGAANYADAAAVIAVLPTVVFCDGGSVGVPVTAWVDTDTYDPDTAGSYTFTATLGDLPVPYANTEEVTATVEVVVSE